LAGEWVKEEEREQRLIQNPFFVGGSGYDKKIFRRF